MAKVLGLHTIELHPGVAPEDYIRFVNDELSPLMEDKLGWKMSVGLGDRGERAGKLILIWEIPSLESRQRFIPSVDTLSEEGQRLLEPNLNQIFATWGKLQASAGATDYVIQA